MSYHQKQTFNDHKEIRTIWWLLAKWDINSMAYKPNSSISFPRSFFKNDLINIYSCSWILFPR